MLTKSGKYQNGEFEYDYLFYRAKKNNVTIHTFLEIELQYRKWL